MKSKIGNPPTWAPAKTAYRLAYVSLLFGKGVCEALTIIHLNNRQAHLKQNFHWKQTTLWSKYMYVRTHYLVRCHTMINVLQFCKTNLANFWPTRHCCLQDILEHLAKKNLSPKFGLSEGCHPLCQVTFLFKPEDLAVSMPERGTWLWARNVQEHFKLNKYVTE